MIEARQRREDHLWPKRAAYPDSVGSHAKSINVIEDTKTGNQPFGFARALNDGPAMESIPGDGWDDYAAALGGGPQGD